MNTKSFKNEILQLRKEGKTYDEIRKIVGCCKSVISYHCRNANLHDPNEFKKPSKETINEFVNLYKELKSTHKVSKQTGWSRHTVTNYLKKTGIKLVKQKTISRSQSVVDWRKRTKLKLVEYKGGCCQAPGCGYKKCVEALTFHHTDPSKKDFHISGKSWSFERLKDEVEKCLLLCSNCHIEVHAGVLIL